MSNLSLKYRLFRTIVCILPAMPLPVSAQYADPEETESLMSGFENRFNAMDSLMALAPEAVIHTLSEQSLDHERIREIDEAVQAEIRLGNSSNGLELSGHLYARPLGRMGYDSDEPMSAYTAKAQLELRWNLFQSSIVNRSLRMRELQLEGEMEQLQYEKESLAMTITDYKLELRDRYNSSALLLLSNHSANLEMLVKAQSHMLSSGDISSPAVLSNLRQMAEVSRSLTVLQSETPSPVEPSVAVNVTEIDSAAVIGHIRNSLLDIRAVNLEIELTDCRTQSIRWFESASLYPFVRYSWYARTDHGYMNNLDAGVGFSIPLSSENRNRRRVSEARKSVLEYRQAQVTERIVKEVSSILQDINTYNRSISAEQQRLDEFRSYIERRRATYEALGGQYDRMTRLEEYNTLLTIWEGLLEYAYRRDLKLADLQSYLTDVPVSEFFNH